MRLGVFVVLSLLLVGCGDGPQEPEFRQMRGLNNFAMIVPKDVDANKLPELAKEHCGNVDMCSVYAWTDAANAATALPMTDHEVETRVFAYDINRNSGQERSLWNCKVYPRSKGDECL